jgi:hypothetical protein
MRSSTCCCLPQNGTSVSGRSRLDSFCGKRDPASNIKVFVWGLNDKDQGSILQNFISAGNVLDKFSSSNCEKFSSTQSQQL